jgi:hypothetical protein
MSVHPQNRNGHITATISPLDGPSHHKRQANFVKFVAFLAEFNLLVAKSFPGGWGVGGLDANASIWPFWPQKVKKSKI